MTVSPAKTQISLGIRPVWSESSLCTQWVDKGPSFLHAISEDSDQTGRMPRLIWVFTGRTTTLLVLSWGGSVFFDMTLLSCTCSLDLYCICKIAEASVKAQEHVDFLMYALSKHKHNPYLKGNRKKWLSSQAIILSKISILASNFFTQMFNVSI